MQSFTMLPLSWHPHRLPPLVLCFRSPSSIKKTIDAVLIPLWDILPHDLPSCFSSFWYNALGHPPLNKLSIWRVNVLGNLAWWHVFRVLLHCSYVISPCSKLNFSREGVTNWRIQNSVAQMRISISQQFWNNTGQHHQRSERHHSKWGTNHNHLATTEESSSPSKWLRHTFWVFLFLLPSVASATVIFIQKLQRITVAKHHEK